MHVFEPVRRVREEPREYEGVIPSMRIVCVLQSNEAPKGRTRPVPAKQNGQRNSKEYYITSIRYPPPPVIESLTQTCACSPRSLAEDVCIELQGL